MPSAWKDEGARNAVRQWSADHGEDFALRLYTARLLGCDSNLVLHGGGNVSLKTRHVRLLGNEVDTLYIKASGQDLADLGPRGLVAVDLEYLRRLRVLDALDDASMVNEIRTHLLDASAPTPSIETLVHAFLPHRFVDHSHADAVLALTNQASGDALIRKALGDRVAIIPYVTPGFALAKVVAKAVEETPNVEGMVFLHHGIITFADDARTSYERHIAFVDACERFIRRRTSAPRSSGARAVREPADARCARAAPILRGLLKFQTEIPDRPVAGPILEWRCNEEIESLIDGPDGQRLAETTALTGDHLIRTKPWYLYADLPDWSNEENLTRQFDSAVTRYRRHYEEYVGRFGGAIEHLDSAPRVILLPGAGLLCWGPTKRDARIAADIAEHTLRTKFAADRIGRYAGLDEKHLFAMEFRELQQIKLAHPDRRPLQGQVVAVSGGAGAIGAAIAEVCAEAGAHVALTDLDTPRLDRALKNIEQSFGAGIAMGVAMDVTDAESVRNGFHEIVRSFGGVDVVVPNAGTAFVSPIEELSIDEFRRVMEVNASGTLMFMQEGVRVLKRQGLGGHVIVVSSKNVLGPGKDFSAYSASKAAAHQLGKVAAIELAAHGIRVNMLSPDAVFGSQESPSGLWEVVGPDRARSRGLPPEELPEYYRQRSLLKTPVLARHVGHAVVFFASNATPTTGATLPIDGGVAEAFPR